MLENLSSHLQPSLMVILFSVKVASKWQTGMVIISRMKLKKNHRILNLKESSDLSTILKMKWFERDVFCILSA